MGDGGGEGERWAVDVATTTSRVPQSEQSSPVPHEL